MELSPKHTIEEYFTVEHSCRAVPVLMVEDNSADVFLVRNALAEEGVNARIFVALDGEEACAFVDRIDSASVPCPDLILIDLNLPKRNGFDVLSRIRQSSRCVDKPTIIFSSSELIEDRQKAAQLGATAYIRKPFDLNAFAHLGRQLLLLLQASSNDAACPEA